MTLLTAHKVLIVSAIGCFLLYAGWEVRQYLATQDALAFVRAAAAGGVAAGFGVYLRTVWRRGSL